MWLDTRSGSCVNFSRLFLNSWLLLSCLTYTVFGQCDYGLETSCVWVHDSSSALRWQLKGDSREPHVELTGCKKPNCGIGLIQSPWMPARESNLDVGLEYKIYGTSKTYLRVNLKLEDTVAPRQLFSKAGNYAHGYPKEWSTGTLTIPATPTRYKLLIKAYTPYAEAMVAVKGINLDGSVITTSTRSSSTTTSTTTTTTKSATARPPSRSTRTSTSTTTTTTTTTAKPGDDEGEILPTHSIPEIKKYSTDLSGTSDDIFPDDDDYEDERRFQALEVENFIGEEDLVKGYTTVVEPQICPYER